MNYKRKAAKNINLQEKVLTQKTHDTSQKHRKQRTKLNQITKRKTKQFYQKRIENFSSKSS